MRGINTEGRQCVECHQLEFDRTSSPVHTGIFEPSCDDCHTENSWQPLLVPSKFKHDSFVLRYQHLKVQCSSCHTKGYKVGDTPNQCYDCHQKDYEGATSPLHFDAAAGTQLMPTDCQQCHEESGWLDSTFGPDFKHPWPLLGAHATAACGKCHTDPNDSTRTRYAGTPKECLGCHMDVYQSAALVKAPAHATTYGSTCTTCHDTVAWTNISSGFTHSTWPLTGRHARTSCGECHKAPVTSYSTAPTACVDCHGNKHGGTSRLDCARCHNTSGWGD